MKGETVKQTNLRTAYAKLGHHPGDMGPQEAEMIFNEAMKKREGATFLEINPSFGRTTVVLGIAARNLGGKLYLACEWQNVSQDEQRWLGRAIALHGLKGTVIVLPDSGQKSIQSALNGGGLDLVLINGEFARTDFLPTGKDSTIITRKSASKPTWSEIVEDHRPIISIWKVTREHERVEMTVIEGGKI